MVAKPRGTVFIEAQCAPYREPAIFRKLQTAVDSCLKNKLAASWGKNPDPPDSAPLAQPGSAVLGSTLMISNRRGDTASTQKVARGRGPSQGARVSGRPCGFGQRRRPLRADHAGSSAPPGTDGPCRLPQLDPSPRAAQGSLTPQELLQGRVPAASTPCSSESRPPSLPPPPPRLPQAPR